MTDKYMFRLAQIKNSYARKRYGNLTDIEKATCDYDSLCLEMIKQLDLYKSVLDEIREIVSKSVFKTDLVELCRMKNQIKEILNKVGGSNE